MRLVVIGGVAAGLSAADVSWVMSRIDVGGGEVADSDGPVELSGWGRRGDEPGGIEG